jgi:hypothetical protein
MKKFTRIFESKEKILDLVGLTESELKSIFQELIDEYDFSFEIRNIWIAKSGHIYYKPNQALETYPCLVIEMKRILEGIKEDPRNWNGGVYYEDDLNLIKLLLNVIKQLENSISGGKIFYAIRNLGEIDIRISVDIEKVDLAIDKEKALKFINSINSKEDQWARENFFNLPNPLQEDYSIKHTFSMGDKKTIEVKPAAHLSLTSIYNRILKDTPPSMKQIDNMEDLKIIYERFVKKFFDICNEKKNLSFGLNGKYGDHMPFSRSASIHNIYLGSDKLIKIYYSIGEERTFATKRKIGGSIFKPEYAKFTFYNIDIDIEFL